MADGKQVGNETSNSNERNASDQTAGISQSSKVGASVVNKSKPVILIGNRKRKIRALSSPSTNTGEKAETNATEKSQQPDHDAVIERYTVIPSVCQNNFSYFLQH